MRNDDENERNRRKKRKIIQKIIFSISIQSYLININHNQWIKALLVVFFFLRFSFSLDSCWYFYFFLICSFLTNIYLYTYVCICACACIYSSSVMLGVKRWRQQITCHFCLPRATTVMFLPYHQFMQDLGQ